jgi:hypothetical protein
MDVICFLCISLGSSTVKLHDSLGSRRPCEYSEASFSSQNSEHAEGYTTEEQRYVVRFLWAKGSNAKVMFPVYGGKCLSRKAVHKWARNVA